jgi:hypothetical protein
LVYEPQHFARPGRYFTWNEAKHARQRVSLEPYLVDSLRGNGSGSQPGPRGQGQEEGEPDFAPAPGGR